MKFHIPKEFLRNASFSNLIKPVVTRCIFFASSCKIRGNFMFLSQIDVLQPINYNNKINCFHFVPMIQI